MVKWLLLATICLFANCSAKCSVSNQRVECGSQTCDENSGECVACTNSSQCFEAVMRCEGGECQVGALIETSSIETVVAFLITIVVCAIAVVAGLGGGGILVPMFAALTDMPMISAVGLSQAAICGQSAFNMSFVLRQFVAVSPGVRRPLVNFQYLAILLPLGFMGTLLGSAFSKVVPDWLRLGLLFTLLTSVLHKVIERARRQFKSDAIRKQEDLNSREMDSLRVDDVTVWPRREFAIVGAAFLILLVCNIVRTRKTECGSVTYIFLFVFPLILLLGLAFLGRRWVETTRSNIVLGLVQPENLTFQWNYKTTVVFPFVAVIAGGAASMLGIGGGLVLSFVLFEAGLPPEEASATSGFATLMIASESALQLIFQGQLVVDYAALYFASGILSTCLGQYVFMYQIRKFKASFMIIVALAIIVGGSLVTLTSYGVYDMVELVKNDASLLAFGHFCKKL